MLNKEILDKLMPVTPEEENILKGTGLEKKLYTENEEFVVDSSKLLKKGKLIDIRTHTRFVKFPKHRHNYIEMIYMCSGSTTHIINNKEITLQSGEILILSQSCVQEILPANENDIAVNFIILPEFFTSEASFPANESVLGDFLIKCLTKGNSFSEYIHFKASDILPIKNLVENMIWNKLNPSPFSRIITEQTMSLLFLQISNHTGIITDTRENYDKKLLIKALHYIETDYKTASLSELSSQLNQSIFIMSKLIKQYTGKTYKELLQTKRLNQAAYLLTHTRFDIASISEAVGYDNRSYFYRIFKENFGVTPREFRKTESI